MKIEFNKPYINNLVYETVNEAFNNNGSYIKKAENELAKLTGSTVFLTNSCTSALEIAAMCLIKPGDEVIMPSWTHPSTANAFVLRGAIPVYADVRADFPNMFWDIEDLITPKTKAIVPVHYAGLSCNILRIIDIATKYKLFIIEDAAQCIDSYFEEQHLGTFSTFGTLSFHSTKNIQCGEGGALIVNDKNFIEKVRRVCSFGTNRYEFEKGNINKYSWVDIGTSPMMNSITAAMLYTNLLRVKNVTDNRKFIWNRYYKAFSDVKNIRLPYIYLNFTSHNAHIFFFGVEHSRDKILIKLNERGVKATSHYYPLHRSSFGNQFYTHPLPNTDWWVDHIIRLPLYFGMSSMEINYVIENIIEVLKYEI